MKPIESYANKTWPTIDATPYDINIGPFTLSGITADDPVYYAPTTTLYPMRAILPRPQCVTMWHRKRTSGDIPLPGIGVIVDFRAYPQFPEFRLLQRGVPRFIARWGNIYDVVHKATIIQYDFACTTFTFAQCGQSPNVITVDYNRTETSRTLKLVCGDKTIIEVSKSQNLDFPPGLNDLTGKYVSAYYEGERVANIGYFCHQQFEILAEVEMPPLLLFLTSIANFFKIDAQLPSYNLTPGSLLTSLPYGSKY